MARRWPRKRNPSPDPSRDGAPVETVRLDDDDHAWWAQEEVTVAWRPRARRSATEPKTDILAEHFGPDWRTSFGFTPTADEPSHEATEVQDPEEPDPYEVLGVEPTAAWEEIIAAHRQAARAHHPDLLLGQSAEAQAEGEERIRVINAAYQELRIRRGV